MSNKSSVRDVAHLETDDLPTYSPEAADGVRALVAVFNRACLALNLDLTDEVVPRKIARSIIEAAIARRKRSGSAVSERAEGSVELAGAVDPSPPPADDGASSGGRPHARSSPQLRMLRQGPALGRGGRDDLHFRVHVLPRLRRDAARRPLPELRRQSVARPIRPADKLTKYPPSTVRVFKPQGCGQAA